MMCLVTINDERNKGRLDSMIDGRDDLVPIKLDDDRYFIELSEEKVQKWSDQFKWMTVLTDNYYSIF